MTGAAPEVESERFRVVGNKVAWLFVPFAALAQAVALDYPVPRSRWLNWELLVLLLLAALASPWLWRRRSQLSTPILVLAAAFTAYIGYALVSTVVRPEPTILVNDVEEIVPRLAAMVPLASALVAMLAGLGLVLAAEAARRLRILAYGGAAAIPVAFVLWPYHSTITRSWRLATGQGGAAVIHVVFLLIAALALACYASRIRPRLFLAVAVAAVVAILATQSRGGLITFGVWLALLALGWWTRAAATPRRLWPAATVVAGLGLLALLLPGASRVLSLADPQRLTNLESSLRLWSGSPATMVFGTGPGAVWPWYLFENMTPPVRPKRLVTPEGVVLGTPHSTPLAVLVETGIVGALLFACVLAAVIVVAVRMRHNTAGLILGSAIVATLVAFLFDTFLLRNFGVSLWWWMVVALLGASVTSLKPDAAGMTAPSEREP